MGNTESSNSLTRITNQTVELSAKSITNCMMQASQKQVARIHGWSIGKGNVRTIDQSMQMVVNVNCTQKAKVDLDIQQAVASAIAQEADAAGTDIAFLTGSDASNTTSITENIKADINMDNIVNTGVDMEQRQQAEIMGGIIGIDNRDEIRQGMTAEVFLAGLADTVKNNKFVQEAAAEIDQKGTAKTESTITNVVDSVAGAFTGSMTMFAVIAIAFFIVMLFMFKSLLGSEAGMALMADQMGSNSDADNGTK
jgi:hypothetical protein